jgi:hypothetical protein
MRRKRGASVSDAEGAQGKGLATTKEARAQMARVKEKTETEGGRRGFALISINHLVD